MRTTTAVDLIDLARAERADLAHFLASLGPEAWDAPTMCTQWRVRDVVAHIVSYDVLSPLQTVGRFVHGALTNTSPSAIGVEQAGALSTAELLLRLETHLTPTGLTAGFHGAIGLTDGLIHHQDIRRPLGHPRAIPAERLRPALDFALRSPRLPARRLTRGLRLAATDIEWASGDGPRVSGPGESLLMAAVGRAGITPELEGPGLRILEQRLEQRNQRRHHP